MQVSSAEATFNGHWKAFAFHLLRKRLAASLVFGLNSIAKMTHTNSIGSNHIRVLYCSCKVSLSLLLLSLLLVDGTDT